MSRTLEAGSTPNVQQRKHRVLSDFNNYRHVGTGFHEKPNSSKNPLRRASAGRGPWSLQRSCSGYKQAANSLTAR